MQRLVATMVVILIALLAAACVGLGQGAPPTATALPVVLASATTESASLRYRNAEGGFSMLLPDGWTVAGPYPVEVGSGSYSLYTLGTDPGSNGGPGTSQMIIADASAFTLEAFLLAQCSTCPEHPVVEATLGGRQARRTQVGGDGVPFTVDWTFVETEGKLVGFSIRDPETLAAREDVLGTIVFDVVSTP